MSTSIGESFRHYKYAAYTVMYVCMYVCIAILFLMS